MVQVRVELTDLGAGAALADLGAAAGDLSPLMDEIGALLEQSTRDRLAETNQSPAGLAWPPSLRVQEFGGKTLHDTGRLAASITREAERHEARIGSNLIYAAIHQTGGEIVPKSGGALRFRLATGQYVVAGKVTIPARPYLGVSDEDEADIGAEVARFLRTAGART